MSEFSDRARSWLGAHAPRPPWPTGPDEYLAFARAFQAELHDAGLAGITWPTAYGGQGLGDAEQREFTDVAAGFALPVEKFTIAMGMCGPTILAAGTDEQKHRFIRPLLRADEIWCQLFSEPGAGSDLAALRTSAVRDGDTWRVNGQKVWTSHAQYSDFGLLLARTDPGVPKHRGLTMFLVDMRAPGVQVRPLRDMTGDSRFNEVFFDDVVLGDEARLGPENGGWKVAIETLTLERMSVAHRIRPQSHALSATSLLAHARLTGSIEAPRAREALLGLHVRERLAGLLGDRLTEEARAGRPPGARGSVGKLVSAELSRYSASTALAVLGGDAVYWDPSDAAAAALAAALLEAPSMGIAGGTNEVQRNIIGERVLGLPREPAADAGAPFGAPVSGGARS